MHPLEMENTGNESRRTEKEQRSEEPDGGKTQLEAGQPGVGGG